MAAALFVLRAQPFHKGHRHAIRHLCKTYDRVILAIGSTGKRNADNPFSYGERRAMIKQSLSAEELRTCRIIGVRDVADDILWSNEVLRKAKADVIVTANPWTKACFPDLPAQKPALLNPTRYRATRIRRLIRQGKRWQALVPATAIPVIERALRKHAGDFLKHV